MTRFPYTSLKQAWERAQATEPWVFPETVCSSVTMIYGRSKVGKSYLVASMVLSLMLKGRKFLGMEPVDRSKLWRPAILCTDPGSEEEYGERIYPYAESDDLGFYYIGRTARPEEWEALTEHLIAEGRNFVVLDNLMGATGDTNAAEAMTTVFDGLTRLTRIGIPVVVLHHETEKGAYVTGAPPMGLSNSVQKSRVWIQVRQTNRRKFRGGNLAMIIRGNRLDQDQELIASPGPGTDQQVISRGPWDSKDDQDEGKTAKKRKRAQDTQDARLAQAEWVVANCQGMGLSDTAQALADQFGKTKASAREALMRGALSGLVSRTGDGAEAAWSRK
nr:AAA family ATPase [Amycolatopsis rubida]